MIQRSFAKVIRHEPQGMPKMNFESPVTVYVGTECVWTPAARSLAAEFERKPVRMEYRIEYSASQA